MGPQFESVDIIAIVGDFIFKIDMAVALVKTGESYRQPAVARCNFPQTAERDEFRNVYFTGISFLTFSVETIRVQSWIPGSSPRRLAYRVILPEVLSETVPEVRSRYSQSWSPDTRSSYEAEKLADKAMSIRSASCRKLTELSVPDGTVTVISGCGSGVVGLLGLLGVSCLGGTVGSSFFPHDTAANTIADNIA